MENDKLTPRQTSDILGIGTETLKKYAALLEHNGHSIGRNARHHRYYTGTDIGLLRAMIVLNRDKSVTLEDSASIVTSTDTDILAILGETDDTVAATVQSTEVSTVIPVQLSKGFNQIFELMQLQQNEIEALRLELDVRDKEHSEFMTDLSNKMKEQTELTKEQMVTIKELRGEIEKIQQVTDKPKPSFWARLFGNQ